MDYKDNDRTYFAACYYLSTGNGWIGLFLQKKADMFDPIESAIEDIKCGKLVIVADDEDRENEGDFIGSAQTITPDTVNFMTKIGRGLICVALPEIRCNELELKPMVVDNSSLHETAFTVSVDLLGNGCTTGISASDRAKTINALVDRSTKPGDLGRPGHIFPLIAKNGGVLRRAGHTEAAVDLTVLAGMEPGGVLVEIMNEDGTMARLPELIELARKNNMKIISIKDLIEYRIRTEILVEEIVRVEMPTKYGHFKLVAFKEKNSGNEHMALLKGEWNTDEPVLVRVHSSCFTGDILGSMRCDCGEQLHKSMQLVEKEGKGAIIYMNQEGRGIGLMNKLKAYRLQEDGMDTVEANLHLGFKMDQRDYGIGAQILRQLGIKRLRLISNNPKKRVGLTGYGLEVVENVPIEMPANNHNKKYLLTKRDKMGHEILEKG